VTSRAPRVPEVGVPPRAEYELATLTGDTTNGYVATLAVGVTA